MGWISWIGWIGWIGWIKLDKAGYCNSFIKNPDSRIR
jgi:hypothetical protein